VCEAPGEACDEDTGRCACEPPFLAPDCNVKMALFAHFGRVRDLAEEQGVLWVTTSTGLWALDFAGTPSDPTDDVWRHFDELTAASESGKLVIDQQGTKWFAGAYERQLVRLDVGGTPLDRADDQWTFYRYTDTFSPNGIGVDTSGNVWLGRYGETLTFSDMGTPDDRADDVWRRVSELGAPATLFELSIGAILSEPPGVVWLGSSTGELFAYEAGTQRFVEAKDLSWSRIDELAWDGLRLWAAVGSDESESGHALAEVPVGKSLAPLSGAESLLHSVPYAIETFDVDAGGRVWVSHGDSGFSCLDPGRSSSSWLDLPQSISSILARSSQDLWLGAESVFHVQHGGACIYRNAMELYPERALRSEARDVAIEGYGVWVATDRGVDYVDTAGTPLDPSDDRWAHFDERDFAGLGELQGVLLGPYGIKYFWGQERVFAFDDGGSPFDKTNHRWVGHDTGPLWVRGVIDSEGMVLIVARANQEESDTPRIVVFDPGETPADGSDDVVTTINSGLPGFGRNMTIDNAGQVWVATETLDSGGNLFHWNRQGTPLDGSDDVWTPVRPESGLVWKLAADPTGGVWGTAAEGVFQFFDGGTPTDLGDDYWHIYPELGSAMDIGRNGNGWFRMPGGVGILDVGGTPREPSDDVAKVLLAPDSLRFQSDLWTNGTIDDQGRFWVVDEYVQVFEFVE
jgi:streptogramin lyase